MCSFTSRLGVVVPKSHRLATKRAIRTVDLADEAFIWSPRAQNPKLHDEVVVAFRAHGITLDIAQEEADGEAILTLVASGAGPTFSVESSSVMVRGGAVVRRVTDLDVVMHGHSLWRASDEGSPLVRSLLDITHSVHAS